MNPGSALASPFPLIAVGDQKAIAQAHVTWWAHRRLLFVWTSVLVVSVLANLLVEAFGWSAPGFWTSKLTITWVVVQLTWVAASMWVDNKILTHQHTVETLNFQALAAHVRQNSAAARAR